MRSSHSLDRVSVIFDDDHAVANAGLILPATLRPAPWHRGGCGRGRGPGHPARSGLAGTQVMTLLHSIVVGGDCIDDADVLRCGSTAEVTGHRVMAPSTLGTFLRSFTFGHVRQLDKVAGAILARAWAAGAGPGDGGAHHGPRLHRLRGARLRQAGGGLRLHPPPRLPPPARHPGGDRRVLLARSWLDTRLPWLS